MANSIPDLNLNTGDWVDVYATTSIPIGTSIIIQNKSSTALVVYLSATKPSGVMDGYSINSFDCTLIDASEAGCWVRGSGTICVIMSDNNYI